MKKFLIFLALCCLMVTGVWAQALTSLTDLQDGIQVKIANKAHSDRYINLDATNAHFATTPTTFTLVGDNTNGFKFYDAANSRYIGPTQGNGQQCSAVTDETAAGIFKMEVGSTGYFKIHCENPAVHSKGSEDATYEYLGWRNATSTLVTWTYSVNNGDFLFTKITSSDIPTFTAKAPNAITSGWYQLKWYDTNSDTKTGVVSNPGGKFVKNYETDITVNSANYPLYLDTDNGDPTTGDESAKTYVYVTRSNTNTGTAANIRSANGHYVAINGTANTSAQNLYIIFRSSSSYPTESVVCSAASGGNRTSWLPLETDGNKYIGQSSTGKFPMVQFSPVNLTEIGLNAYTVSVSGTTEAVQVTYTGTDNKGLDKVYNGGTFFFGTSATPANTDFSVTEIEGKKATVTVDNTNHTITVAYNLLPFTTGRTYNLTLKGNIVYYDEATGYIKAGNVEDSENTCFVIGGTYADGYTIKSVGANEYLKHENVNNDNAKATTTANESEATRYEYAVKDGYHYFKIRGTDNNYVNDRDGYFSSWNSGSALGNDGSRLTFSEALDPDKGYHIFQNNGTLNTTGSSDYCSQWTSSRVNPQISINVTDGNGAANDMERSSTYANNGIVCYTGNNRDQQGYKATLTVAASYGYKITGFEFDASKADVSDYTIDVTAGGTTKTVSGTTAQHFSQTGVNAQEFVIVIKETATSATHNKPILLSNFYVTYEAAEPLESEYKLVFDNANSSVPYRIPAVGQTKDGDLIFVADYRYSKADIGAGTRLDLRYRKKYASDGHWGNVETLAAYIPEPFCAFGDPCIVCDRESNRVMVTSCCGNVSFPSGTYNNHQGWARWYSNDGGETWESSFTDLAPQVVEALDKRQGDQMQAFFIGSGKISQSHIIKKGQYYRLYCASNTRMQSGKCNFVWYSDDFGETWNILGSPDVKAINGGDEPKADELPDGSVVISSRDTGRIFNIFHYTDYENATGYWGSQATSSSNNSGCYGTGCNGEILIVPVMKKSDNTKTYLALQSIPAASDRRNVSIYWKELTNFGQYRNASELAPNWTKFQVSGTTSAYSTMCQMQDGDIAFFYEENSYNSGYDMVYKKFSVEAITDDAYEFYDLNAADKATEKAAYLTSCVGTYFDTQTADIQALADAYEAAPTMKNYDALNAALQSPDELFFTPGLYQIQVASGTAQNHDDYTGNYIYGKTLPANWPIGLTQDDSDERTYVYIWGSHNDWHMEFNHGKENAYYATTDCKSNTTAAGSLSFIPNADKTEWKIWGGNQRWMGWTLSNEPSVGSTSTSNPENDNCYFIFTKVDTPPDTPDPVTATYTLNPASGEEVEASELAKVTITFTGDDVEGLDFSEDVHPTLTKEGETAISGTIEMNEESGEWGIFDITFNTTDMASGEWTLSIPQGVFSVMKEINSEIVDVPVAEIKANYTVEEPVTPESVEVPYTLTPTDGATITSVDDLATITLQFTGEDVEEGLMPMTAEDMEKDPVYPTLTKGSTVITATSIAMNDDTGLYDITFPTTGITDGEWKLCIPEGAFYTMDWLTLAELVVAEITATYTVASVVPEEVVATLTINGVETNYHEGDDIVLNDGEAGLTKVVIPNDVDNVDVTYTREFTGNNATAWQAWYVPFKYTLTSEDVETFDFAYIWTLGVDVKTGKATNIIYEDLVEGDVLKANTPYLIKAKAATDSYEFNATGLCATKGNHIDCSTTKYQYDFVGSYESFVLGEQPYYALDNNGAFAYTSSTTYKLQPYRYYMYITEKKTNSILDPHSSSNVQKLTLIHRGENDEQTTSINAINGNDNHATTVDLTGRIVSNPRAGLFISNGKKYIVK